MIKTIIKNAKFFIPDKKIKVSINKNKKKLLILEFIKLLVLFI